MWKWLETLEQVSDQIWPVLRLISFVVGLAIIINEALISGRGDYRVLGAGLTMMGLPWWLWADRRRRED